MVSELCCARTSLRVREQLTSVGHIMIIITLTSIIIIRLIITIAAIKLFSFRVFIAFIVIMRLLTYVALNSYLKIILILKPSFLTLRCILREYDYIALCV